MGEDKYIPPTELPGEVIEEPVVPHDKGRRKLALSTIFFSLATALSRVAGLFREVVAASYFGVTGPMSAFTIAFQVPNLIRSLVADAALQSAFVPVFTEQLEKGRRIDAIRLASTLFYLILLGLGSVTALFIVIAPWLIPLFAPGFDPELQSLTVSLAQMLFPIVLLLGISGLVVGILNSYDHFSVPAIAPLFWNITIIVLLFALTGEFEGDDRIYAYAIAVLSGTVVQLVLPLPWLKKYGFKLVRAFDWRDKRVRKVLKLMLPITLGLGLINFNLSVDSIFATLISDQAPAAIDKAFRVYMLPQGIFSVAVATVLFPTLSRMASKGDRQGMVTSLAAGSRYILIFLLPAAAATLVLSEPITQLLYQRGEFDAAQTKLVAEALAFFAPALPFAGLNLLLTRAFFSLQRPWLPTMVAAVNIVMNGVLDALLYKPMGIGGIPLATVIVSVFTTIALAYLLRRHVGPIQGKKTLWAGFRMLIGAAVLAAVTYGTWSAISGSLGESFGNLVLGVGAALVAGAIVYAVAVLAMRVPEAVKLKDLIVGRILPGR